MSQAFSSASVRLEGGIHRASSRPELTPAVPLRQLLSRGTAASSGPAGGAMAFDQEELMFVGWHRLGRQCAAQVVERPTSEPAKWGGGAGCIHFGWDAV